MLEKERRETVGQIELLSGQEIGRCFQCGVCTAGCPTSEEMDLNPRQAMLLLRLGVVDEVLSCNGIWLCASCLVCGTRCPRGIDYARIAEACRALVLRRKQSHVDPDTATEKELEEIPQQAFIAGYRKFSG